jgi:hypothetical protein
LEKLTRDQIARAFLFETGMFDSIAEINCNKQHWLVKAAYKAADKLLHPRG